jgi:multiple sugar transport system permease protein
MAADRREVVKWTIVNVVVVICALFPVFWILMLSLKDPATISDGRLIPSKW